MSNILELDISLKNIKPKIWRRVLVPSDMTFHELHFVIQFAMGWENAHLYQFIVGKREEYIGTPMEGDWNKPTNSKRTLISRHLKTAKNRITYEYDFGDSWEHEIVVKKVLEVNPTVKYPLLIDGGRACPPEDCGGFWGYERLLEVINNPRDEEYEDIMEWLGEGFDPEAFDVKETNSQYFGNFKQAIKDSDF